MNNTQKEIKAIEDKIRKTIKKHEQTLEKLNDSNTRNFMNGVIAGLRVSLLCFPLSETKNNIKEKQIVKVNPKLTQLNDWIEAIVIDVENNPFKGVIIAVKDFNGNIYYGEEKYFKTIE